MQSRAKLDPAPRSYPPAVTLVRRAQRHGESIPNLTTAAAIEEWLLSSAIRENDLLGLFHSFVLRLVTAGLLLERVSLHVGTLHPQLIGFGWVWEQSDGLCDEFQVAEAALRSHA